MAKSNILSRSRKRKIEELLNRNELNEAQSLCRQLCQTNRGDAEAWTLLGMIERRLGQFAEAEQAGRRATALAPNLASAHQVLGMALQCRGSMAEAIACYQKAIELAPGAAQNHYLLGNALRETGALAAAEASYARAIKLQADFLPALGNRGAALIALGRTEAAKACLSHANELQPGLPQVLCNLAQVAQQEGKFEPARAYCQQALQREPDFVDAIAILAELSEKSHCIEDAKELVRRGLALAPDCLSLSLTAARLARRDGRLQDAISLLEDQRTRLPESLQAEVLILLGQLYDKTNDTAQAFTYLEQGNRIKMANLLTDQDDGGQYLRRLAKLKDDFRAARPQAWHPHAGDDFHDNPVFLLGFLRSGTTLLEQVLDSHPQLQALGEKPAISAVDAAFQRLSAGRSAPYRELTLEEINRLRKVYFDDVARHIQRDPQRLLVDKLALNTEFAHLIWRIFPKAKVILAVRHPLDVCLSCYMQSFSPTETMTTFLSLENTARAYAGVMGLWRDYVEALPIDYHRVRYEDLVADQAGETKRLLDFLGLEWDDKVMRHDRHARTRDITTPSYHQVTKPIYQDARYRWKRYEKQLQPILPILQPYIEYFGYGDDANITLM